MRTIRPYYERWREMMRRCYDQSRKDFRFYGSKGVTVCEEWHDFRTFAKWISNNMTVDGGLVVDRVDPRRGYSPDNCRLITRTENSRRAIYRRDRYGRFATKEVA